MDKPLFARDDMYDVLAKEDTDIFAQANPSVYEASLESETITYTNWRNMFKRYMKGVGEAEGVYFVEDSEWSEQELGLINKVIEEIRDGK